MSSLQIWCSIWTALRLLEGNVYRFRGTARQIGLGIVANYGIGLQGNSSSNLGETLEYKIINVK